MNPLLPIWPRAHGGPAGGGILKAAPEHFQVKEILGFEPEREGEHVFLWVEKTGLNTLDVVAEIARFASVHRRQVSYAGLKDKHALTWQWYSVHWPGKRELPWEDCRGEGFRVLSWTRNKRKLKRGALTGNRFEIQIHGFSGDRRRIEGILVRLAEQGMPNYFGSQRFGHQAGNIATALAWFAGEKKPRDHHLKGMSLSAARALIFNQVLSTRLERGDWCRPLQGDLFMFDEGRAFFRAEKIDADIISRTAAMKIHPTGPLWGRGGDYASLDAGEIEQQAAGVWRELAQGLEDKAVKSSRRSLRVRPKDLSWFWEGDDLRLQFALPAGAYATTLIRELIEIQDGVR